MITVAGKSGIRATILAHSVSPDGVVFLTYELEYPRLVLSELNTHRMLSKNSFSSRAVPFQKMLGQLTGEPVRFGANQAGMQDQGEDYDAMVELWEEPSGIGEQGFYAEFPPKTAWEKAKQAAIGFARAFYEAKYHKQVYNRLLEPWQMMKTVLSGTEFDNFFWLRDDDAADPTLRELARVMKEARDQSTPVKLKPGEWHLPYLSFYNEQIGWEDDDTPIYGPQVFYIGEMGNSDFEVVTLEQAIKISCARCAAVSYRNEGYGVEKSIEVYDRLVGSDKKHASAFEHCATPAKPMEIECEYEINVPTDPDSWEEGITHMDRNYDLWSGNLKGWRQYRKMIPGENYTGE